MTLAADILNRSGLSLSPPLPRKPRRDYIELAEAREVETPPFRNTPVRYGNKYEARVMSNRVMYRLGMHDSSERARLAVGLFKHWLKTYPAKDIPRGEETKPVVPMPEAPPTALLERVLKGDAQLTTKERRAVIVELLTLRAQIAD